ncbi:RdgB/HAM1 family non-canonical purine NTP pyrophosphatase [bacterium]|nr:RdgB/HAM1 family non-canonical purine NTP pyrophosphatase [bacterium]
MVGSCNNYRPSGDRLLLVATTNQNKVFEIRTALGQLGIPLCSLKDFPQVGEAPETGSTFAENASQKANYYWKKFQKPVLAEDSGLIIPSLGGFPGVQSARIAPDDQSRIEIVLDKLKNPELSRNAHYICSIMLIVNGSNYAVEGRCDGTLLETPDGTQGFGYDPIFLPDGALRPFGRMSIKEKSQYSHRAEAIHRIIPYLISEFRKIPA